MNIINENEIPSQYRTFIFLLSRTPRARNESIRFHYNIPRSFLFIYQYRLPQWMFHGIGKQQFYYTYPACIYTKEITDQTNVISHCHLYILCCYMIYRFNSSQQIEFSEISARASAAGRLWPLRKRRIEPTDRISVLIYSIFGTDHADV